MLVKYLASENKLKITYTVERTPLRAEQVKVDIDQVRGVLREKLFMTAWGDHYYGVDFDKELESKIFMDGRIEVKGKEEETCKDKTDEILKVLKEALGPLSYGEPEIKNVMSEDEITTDIACVVPSEILAVVKQEFSPTYDVRDVRFGFKKVDQADEVTIFFERPIYKGGVEVPMKLTVVAPTEEIADHVLTAVRNKLEAKAA